MRNQELSALHARRRDRENAIRHAMGILTLVVVLFAGYVLASAVTYRATVVMHNAILGHDH